MANIGDSDGVTATSVPQHEHEPKVRKCLMCRNQFDSNWAGERVCKPCKSQSRWRSSASSVSF